MRIRRLDILRYRALADVSLPFRAGAKLHVVYGPQEAGKSTALEAISDALFGMPRALQPNAVRFAPGELRLGMTLEGDGGQTLSFRRRKADRDTLLVADEAGTLPDHALAPFTGALDRDGFRNGFALTSDRLREAGAELLTSGGDAGSALFAASAGLAGLSDVSAALDREADALFGPRRKADRRFYMHAAEHDAAKAAEGEALLSGSHWKDLRRKLAEAQERQQATDAERAALRREIAELETLGRAAPVHARIGALGETLADYDDLAGVPEGFVLTLERLAEAKHRAALAQADEEEALERATARLEEAVVDDRFRLNAERIEALHLKMGAVAAEREQLPRRRAELDAAEAAVAHLAKGLGIDVEAMERRRPAEPQLAVLADFAARGRRLETLRESLVVGDDEGDVEAFDPAPLHKRFRALGPALARAASLPERRHALGKAEREAKSEAARLSPAVLDLDAASHWNLPDESRLERAGEAIANARIAADEAAREARRLEKALAELDAAVSRDAERAVVSRADIEAARNRRDAAIETDDRERARGLVAEADRLADLAFRHAEAVAFAERRIGEREATAAVLDTARRQRDEAAEALLEAEAALVALFPFVQVDGADATALSRWRARLDDLRGRWAAILADRDAVGELEREADEARTPLAALAGSLGIEADTMPTTALAALVEEALAEAASRWTDAGERKAVAAARDRERKELAAREAAWNEERAAIATHHAVASDASPAMLEAALRCWSRVPDALERRDNLRHRVKGMEADIARFETRVAETVREIEPALQDLAPDAAVVRLDAASREAVQTQTRRRELERQLADIAELLERRTAEASRASRELADATASLDGDDAQGFDVTLRRLNERDDRLAQLARERQTLGEMLAGNERDDLEAALDAFDPVEADLKLGRLHADDAALEEQARTIHTELYNLRSEIERLERAGGAEDHAFRRNAAAARMADAGRRWLVLRAARALLDGAVARARAAETGPWLTRAGALFADLTDRSFERIEQDWSAGDAARLVGVRPNGEKVATDGMSEGTRDQLYLSLRLAHLAERAQTQGSMPFIGDDIFMTFDRPRTRNGLRALAAVSDAVQPILFTHHDFVVEEARAALGNDLDLLVLSAVAEGGGITSRPVEDVPVG